mmetsp:Transcript_34964/g.62936  ORF Transcript_34964/g.62936 Transcript_34964/m.62936 type:complete len:260 (+) Transcript_34964:1-780(+)
MDTWQKVPGCDWSVWFGAAMPTLFTKSSMLPVFEWILPAFMFLHVTQTLVSLALWQDFSLTCWRVQFDRLNAAALTSLYLLCAWCRGGIVLSSAVCIVLLFAGLFFSTFYTEPRTGQYVFQHLGFRFCAYGLNIVVMHNSYKRYFLLFLVSGILGWIWNFWAISYSRKATNSFRQAYLFAATVSLVGGNASAFLEHLLNFLFDLHETSLVSDSCQLRTQGFASLVIGVLLGVISSVAVISWTGEIDLSMWTNGGEKKLE